MRYHLTTARMAIIKRPQITNVVEDVEKREPLHTVGGNINWCSHWGKQLVQLLGIYPKKMKTLI